MRVLAAPLVLAGVLTGLAPATASAASCQPGTGTQPPSPGTAQNQLTGVAVLSACNAWAVGFFNNGAGPRTLILHWNGTRWAHVASPKLLLIPHLYH